MGVRVAALIAVLVLSGSSVARADTTAADVITGTDAGVSSHVEVFGSSGALLSSFFAYEPSFLGGVRVAAGDVNGDGVADIVTGAGPGGAPHVKVFDGLTGAEIRSFLAYDVIYNGGIYVAAGDVTGDGRADIITGTDVGGAPHVKVFDGLTNAVVMSFFAYDATFTGGVRVAAGDLDGDGRADIVTGTGPGSSHVKVFSGATNAVIRSFFAYDTLFTGGVYVAVGDVTGDGRDDIITGAGNGGGPHVKAFSGMDGSLVRSFFAYDPSFSGGVRVAAGDVDGDGRADIVTGTGPGGGTVKVFSGASGAEIRAFLPYGQYTGGVFVAARPGTGRGTTPRLDQLTSTVKSYGLPRGQERALVAKLDAAGEAVSVGDVNGACGVLGAFEHHVRAQTGKALTTAQAATLTDDAEAIRTALGCASS